MPFAVTLFYAAILALILLGLSLQVVRLRRAHQVGLGSGGVAALERAVRAQANFCEYVPLALVLMLLLEGTGLVPGWLLHVLGLALVAGRILHGFFGLNRSGGTTPGRLVGTALTWLVLAAGALFGLGLAVGHWVYPTIA